MLDEIRAFSKSKRTWLKAFEVMTDIVKATSELKDDKEE
jgi:hypothetical protein